MGRADLLTRAANGTYYFPFFNKEDKGRGNIGYSRLINGEYEEPVKMGPDINQGNYIAHPYVAPAESYLMWSVEDRPDGYGQADIFISFRREDGTWMKSMNMGPLINTELQEGAPSITLDGKYLFFNRGEWKTKENSSWVGKSYWVDAKIINNLRPNE